MNRKNIILLIVIAMFSLNLSGCIGVNGNFKKMRNYVFENLDDNYKKTVELSFGPSTMALASTFVTFAVEEDFVDDIIRQVNRVQVGVYEKKSNRYDDPSFEFLKDITDVMEGAGWKFIVRSKNHDEIAAVFIRANAEKIHHMFVIAQSDQELVLTEIRGDLTKIVEIAIREQGTPFMMAKH